MVRLENDVNDAESALGASFDVVVDADAACAPIPGVLAKFKLLPTLPLRTSLPLARMPELATVFGPAFEFEFDAVDAELALVVVITLALPLLMTLTLPLLPPLGIFDNDLEAFRPVLLLACILGLSR